MCDIYIYIYISHIYTYTYTYVYIYIYICDIYIYLYLYIYNDPLWPPAPSKASTSDFEWYWYFLAYLLAMHILTIYSPSTPMPNAAFQYNLETENIYIVFHFNSLVLSYTTYLPVLTNSLYTILHSLMPLRYLLSEYLPSECYPYAIYALAIYNLYTIEHHHCCSTLYIYRHTYTLYSKYTTSLTYPLASTQGGEGIITTFVLWSQIPTPGPG